MAGRIQTLFQGMQSLTPLTEINKLTEKITEEEKQFHQRNSTHREGHERRETVVSSPALDSNNPEKKLCEDRFP